MQTHKSNYFNACAFLHKLLLLIIFGFGVACDKQNKAKQDFPHAKQVQITESAINLNTASIEDLEKLPNIGNQRAREIARHREKFGRFRKPEHLLMVRGISDELFRKIRPLIKVE